MSRHAFPSRPERWLRSMLGDTPRAATIIGDLREEYADRPPGLWRSLSYGTACVSIALRYMPTAVFDALRVEFRQSTRGLLRSPTYTLASVVTLALGIGI